MLDLLQLAPDCTKGKPKDRESHTREERFNLLFTKLRERNMLNDAFIKKYRQKIARKRVKFPQVAARLTTQVCEGGGEEKERDEDEADDVQSSKRTILRTTKDNGFSQKQLAKEDLLKETNHTLTEDVSDDEEKTLSFPNLDFCSQQTDNSPSKKPKAAFQNIKQDKQFNRYLRNVFFKQMTTKLQTKKALADRQEGEARRSMGRMKTEMNSKYQLNIKSLIFGSQQASSSEGKHMMRNQNSEKHKKVQAAIDRLKNIDRYEKDHQFHDDKISSKGMLPIIHNHQVTKNKRFLQNYIKYNNYERLTQFQPAQARTISIANETQMIIKKQAPSRIGLSLRIQTINIQKCT